MSNTILIISAFLVFYVIGSVPFGLLLARAVCNVDIRSVGSGNIGATNAVRVGGVKLGFLVFLCDGIKGVIAVLGGIYLEKHIGPSGFPGYLGGFLPSLFALAALLGHLFPVFLKFRGGKGVSVFACSLFVLNWKIGVVFAVVWIILFALKRYASLASVSALLISYGATYFMFMYIDFHISLYLLLFVNTAACLIMFKHISNICRLIDGSELKFNVK